MDSYGKMMMFLCELDQSKKMKNFHAGKFFEPKVSFLKKLQKSQNFGKNQKNQIFPKKSKI